MVAVAGGVAIDRRRRRPAAGMGFAGGTAQRTPWCASAGCSKVPVSTSRCAAACDSIDGIVSVGPDPGTAAASEPAPRPSPPDRDQAVARSATRLVRRRCVARADVDRVPGHRTHATASACDSSGPRTAAGRADASCRRRAWSKAPCRCRPTAPRSSCWPITPSPAATPSSPSSTLATSAIWPSCRPARPSASAPAASKPPDPSATLAVPGGSAAPDCQSWRTFLNFGAQGRATRSGLPKLPGVRRGMPTTIRPATRAPDVPRHRSPTVSR